MANGWLAQLVSAGVLYTQGWGFKSLTTHALKDCYLDSRKNGRAYDGSGVATAKRSRKQVSKLPMVEWSWSVNVEAKPSVFRGHELFDNKPKLPMVQRSSVNSI